jgi:hypothetical protein
VIQSNSEPLRAKLTAKHYSTTIANAALRAADPRIFEKVEYRCHSLAPNSVWHSWIRKHKAIGTITAIAAGLIDKALSNGGRIGNDRCPQDQAAD